MGSARRAVEWATKGKHHRREVAEAALADKVRKYVDAPEAPGYAVAVDERGDHGSQAVPGTVFPGAPAGLADGH